MRASAIITPPPTGTQPPARLVPAPRARNGTFNSLQTLTMRTICSVEVGKDDDVGLVLLDGEAIALVDLEVRTAREHAVGADDGAKAVESFRS